MPTFASATSPSTKLRQRGCQLCVLRGGGSRTASMCEVSVPAAWVPVEFFDGEYYVCKFFGKHYNTCVSGMLFACPGTLLACQQTYISLAIGPLFAHMSARVAVLQMVTCWCAKRPVVMRHRFCHYSGLMNGAEWGGEESGKGSDCLRVTSGRTA